MSLVTVVVTYPNANQAGDAARRLRARRSIVRSVIFEGGLGVDLPEAAGHAAATRLAALGMLAAMATSAVATAGLMVSGWMAPEQVLALGAAITLTGAPFAGGLAGFTLGMHRWAGGESHVVPWDPATVRQPTVLAVRTAVPELVFDVLFGDRMHDADPVEGIAAPVL